MLQTERLLLRPLRPGDAAAIAAGLGDWRVLQWLAAPPSPYRLKDARWFIGDESSAGARAIMLGRALIGIVDLRPGIFELGYWLAPAHWRRGYMSEACRAVLGAHFASGGGDVTSGFHLGNLGSEAVLLGLGFLPQELTAHHARPLGRRVAVRRMRLTAEAFRASGVPVP